LRVFRAVWALLAVALSGGFSGRGWSEGPPEALSPKAQEAIRLVESQDAYTRQLGFLRLEALREPATSPIIKRYVDHKDPTLRALSLRAVAAVDGSSAVPLLRERLASDSDAQVRRAALLGLEVYYKTHPDVLPAFIGALRDRSVEVRMTAADVVSRIDEPSARDAIRQRYRRERRKDVRRVLKAAMARIDEASRAE
jgi:HEAT repeat protein